MTRGIIIAGNGSPLFSALCVEAAKRVETYTTALIPSGDAQNNAGTEGGSRQFMLDWNPASPLSGRTLVLSAVNKMDHIDDAVLVCVPPACRKNVENLSSAEIDGYIDNNIKGWFFLIRELAAVFRARGRGTLSLVLPELGGGSREDTPDLIGPAIAAAFHSFAQNVLLASISASYDVLGFSSGGGEENAFAAYVFKTMEEAKRNRGKWHKFGKFSFFGR